MKSHSIDDDGGGGGGGCGGGSGFNDLPDQNDITIEFENARHKQARSYAGGFFFTFLIV